MPQPNESPIVDYITEREDTIKSHIVQDVVNGQGYCCNICHFTASSRHKVFCHLESKHFRDSSVSYECSFCGKAFPTRNAYGSHMSKMHRGDK